MRIVYATRSAGHFVYVAPVVMPLSAAGHEVEMLFHPDLAKDYPTPADLQAGLCTGEGQTAGWILRRPRATRWALDAARNLLTYSGYLTRKDQSAYYRRRWEQYLPRPVRWSLGVPGVRRLIASSAVRSSLRTVERAARPDRRILAYLRQKQPHALVASPLNYWGSEEVEYVKAARQLGIPTVLYVFSWDNLTTKSLLYEIPDLVLVWNRKQVDEAAEIHGVPRDRIVITGAPHFDDIIAYEGRGLGREEFCAKVGLDPRKPYVVYLGSSSFIAADETWMVEEIASALRSHASACVRDVQLLVRPHPAHAKIYESLEGGAIKVWPRRGAKLGSPGFTGDFHDTLKHAVGAIGINTSGMFNAVVMDKPCITVITPRYRETQEEALHFRHLIEGSVLEVAHGPADCAGAVERLLKGEDAKRPERRRFVEGWIRPRGLERRPGDIIAQAIGLLAEGKSPEQIDARIESRPEVEAFVAP